MEPKANKTKNLTAEQLKEQVKIVRYDNLMNIQKKFNALSPAEQDIFFMICAQFNSINGRKKEREKLTYNITLKSDTVRKAAGYTGNKRMSSQKFIAMLNHLGHFIMTSDYTARCFLKDEKGAYKLDEKGKPIFGTVHTVLFSTFYVGDNGILDINLNERALHMFSGFLRGNYTEFYLKSFRSLKSKYAKAIFRKLLEGKNAIQGSWIPTRNEFNDWLNIKNLSTEKKFYKSFENYINEIRATNDFDFLQVEKIYDINKRGKPLKKIKFEYRINKFRMKEMKITQDDTLENKLIPAYKKIIQLHENKVKISKKPIMCPYCGGHMFFYEKNGKKNFVCDNDASMKLGNQKCTERKKAPVNSNELWNEQKDKEGEFYLKAIE